MIGSRLASVACWAAVFVVLLPASARACPMCAESSANSGRSLWLVAVLIAVPFLVAGGAAFAITLARRQRQPSRSQSSAQRPARLIESSHD